MSIETRPLRPYVNGRLVGADQPALTAHNSGFNFADGVFEGIRVYDRRIFRLDEHIARLFESARALEIEAPVSSAELKEVIIDWLRQNDVTDAHFRPIITRGDREPPRLDPRYAAPGGSLVIVGSVADLAPRAGIRVIFSSVRRTPPDCLDPKIKSINYGNNLLARLEAIRRNVDDALMLDTWGFVSEASVANVFIVRKGRLLTPLPKSCLDGITRQEVISIASRLGIEVEARDISTTEFLSADECFLCGTAAEITPVVEIEGRQLGAGATGTITQAVLSEYRKCISEQSVTI